MPIGIGTPRRFTELVKPDWVKPGATVIDVGIIGPMTIAMLMANTVVAARGKPGMGHRNFGQPIPREYRS